MQTLSVSRVVFSIYVIGWHMVDYTTALPESWDSLTIIYLPDVDVTVDVDDYRDWYPVQHWNEFQCVVRLARGKGKRVTVVNANSVTPLLDRIPIRTTSYACDPPVGETIEDRLRELAISAVDGMDNVPPGPVCPVHFITLEQYRDHVGEAEFAIDTTPTWTPKFYGPLSQ